jgi:3-hydroxyacyl-CoA dehydrogenase/enoyl-CoA hydratase/3-hydroxybutyryl-CoA epimerase
LEENTGPETVLCTNTSSLCVQQIEADLKRPERLAGLHFFNPVHKMPLVEVIRAPATAERVLADLYRWSVALGKTPVIVKDSPGFVVNRVLMPYLAEAVLLASQDVAISVIDQTMRRFGMPMGPLELIDQVGIDVAAHIARGMASLFAGRWQNEPRLQQLPDTFERMQKNGWLGQKAAVGFYRYQGKKRKVHAAAAQLLSGDAAHDGEGLGGLSKAMQASQARERLVLLMANEAAACLDEGLAGNASAIDLAMVLGTGWAPHRGGPLRYARDRGWPEVLQALETLAQHLGPRFEPCAGVKRLAGQEVTGQAR